MEIEQFLLRINKQWRERQPFVVYKKPDDLFLKGLFQQNETLYTSSDFSESGFIFAPFDSNKPSVLIPLKEAELFSLEVDRQELLNNEFALHHEFDNWNNPRASDKQSHIIRVQNAINAIEDQQFSKVVISRKETLSAEGKNPVEIFISLLHHYPNAFIYLWYHPQVGMWLGATPETLLKISGNQLKTMALAGTQNFEGSENVVWRTKEKEEQQIVTDFIVDQLRRSLNNKSSVNDLIKVSEPRTIKAGNLLHLQTEISLRLPSQSKNLKPILDALHPTPAVCGFPKEIAKKYILEHEGYNRSFYSGFLGELNFKEVTTRNPNRRNVENNAYNIPKPVSNLYVNLRCMEFIEESVSLFVGGGITKDSDPVSEWEETVHKSKIIKKVL